MPHIFIIGRETPDLSFFRKSPLIGGMTKSMTLPDAAARERIANDLDTNLVVEAAAGTGKTTAMVERILDDDVVAVHFDP